MNWQTWRVLVTYGIIFLFLGWLKNKNSSADQAAAELLFKYFYNYI